MRRPAEPDPDHAGEGMQAMARRRTALTFLFLCLLTAGCGAGSGSQDTSAPTPDAVTVQLDWYPNPDHVGLFTAADKGFFGRERLEVTTRAPSDVSDPVKLVATGRIDLGISYEPELFFAQQRDVPVVAVAAIVPTALNSIITRGDLGIDAPSDLRGHTIGVDGSQSTDAYLDTVLRTAGLDPEQDVERVDVGFNLVPALLGKKVDAIIGAFQNIEGAQLESRGLTPTVFPVDRYGVPPYDELVVVAHRDRLRDDAAYRSVVRRFVRALAAGTRYAKEHPGAALEVMRDHASRDYRDVLERSVPQTLRLLDTTQLDPVAWDRFGKWMEQQGLLESPPDGAALVAAP
jgi:putative hydroxymethylpyrimidine transport system substrate-binding protein